jgi:hypothetical protein
MNKYLITSVDGNTKPFFTNYYSYENNYVDNMIVYDLFNSEYTIDGINWLEIDEDHL